MSTVPNSYFASDGSSILLYFNSFPRTFAALSMIAILPITNGRQQSWISSLNIVPTTISGPIPAGSPIVIAVTGLYCVLIIFYFPFVYFCLRFRFDVYILHSFFCFCNSFSVCFVTLSQLHSFFFMFLCIFQPFVNVLSAFSNIFFFFRLFLFLSLLFYYIRDIIIKKKVKTKYRKRRVS